MAIINGTQFNDSDGSELIGTSDNDTYFGFDGRDWLIPTLGSDVLDGGGDDDVAIYIWTGQFTSGVFVNNTDSTVDGVAAFTTDKRGFGTDSLVNLENFHATDADDILHLTITDEGTYSFDEAGDDIVYAYLGNTDEGHKFNAGLGSDAYFGSTSDEDKIDYDQSYTGNETGVTVVFNGLGVGSATDPWGFTDSFTGIEEIEGTDLADTITTGLGNNELVGRSGDDTLIAGGGRDDIFGGAGDDVIDGGDGDRDEARYDDDFDEGGTAGVTVNLTTGVATDGFGDTDTLTGIEDVRGSQVGDTITGNADRNRLVGDDGNDTLTAVENTGDVEDWDTGDDLVGEYGDDTLIGSDGNDELRPGAGTDTVSGGGHGEDGDTLGYNDDDDATTGVTVAFSSTGAGTATDWAGDTDTFSGIENVRTTDFDDVVTTDDEDNRIETYGGDDTITANGGDDRIEGGDGDDAIYGGAGRDRLYGGAGDDTLDGGDGDEDQVRYNDDADDGGTAGVIVDLSANTAIDGFGDTDTLTGIERVTGTDQADTITGNSDRNRLEGRDGNDTLIAVENTGDLEEWRTGDELAGGYGDDTLIGSDGTDYIQPGSGADTIDGGDQTNRSRDELSYYYDDDASTGITVNFTGQGAGTVVDWGGFTDTFVGIEQVQGTAFDDVMTGSDADDGLRGYEGNDTFYGGGGQDNLEGGDGDDLLDGGDGGDYFEPGAGADTIIGGDVKGPLGQSDALSYFEDADAGITVTFTSDTGGTVVDWSGATDTFTGIEYVEATLFADTLNGSDGNDQFRGFAGNDVFNGGDGDEDQVDYSQAQEWRGASQGVTVNLSTGTATDAWGDTDTLSSIEEIRGTDWADTLTGSDQRNRLDGGDGDDVIDSGGGEDNNLQGGRGSDTIISRGNNDYINTGSGDDTVTVYGDRVFIDMGLGDNTIIAEGTGEITLSYDRLDVGVTVDLQSGSATKQGGSTDVFSNVTAIRGSFGDDTLLGSAANYEEFRMSVGTDSVDGRTGEDQLTYRDVDDGNITFDLTAGTATSSVAGFGTTTFANIERFEGGDGDDVFIGDAEDNNFRGLVGQDSYDGGDGTDRVRFSYEAQTGAVVDLAAGTATDGYGNEETLVSIESLFGTSLSDTFLGDDAENNFWGDNADDVLDGRGGTDYLGAGFGTDTLTGGSGDDEFYGWLGHLDGDTITDLEAGDSFAIYSDGWGDLIEANIWSDADTIYIDTTGDGAANATLVNGSGFVGTSASLGGPIGGTPDPAVVSLSGAGGLIYSAPEGTGDAQIVSAVLIRSGDAASAVTVDYVVKGGAGNAADSSDVTAGFGIGQVVFAAGQIEATIEVEIAADADIELDEMLELELTSVSSDGLGGAEFQGGTSGLIRILNDDTLQRVSIEGGKSSEGSGDVTFELTREGPDLSQSLVATVVLTGGDGPRQANDDDIVGGLPQTVQVTFAAGQDTASFSLDVVQDDVSEFHESVLAQIVGLSGAAAAKYEIGSGQSEAEIRNDDGIPALPPGLDASSAMDPHLFTFDGLNYDFMAVGEFVLLEAKSGDPLTVQVRYAPVSSSDFASYTAAVTTDLGGVTVEFDIDADDPFLIDGVATDVETAVGGLNVGTGSVYYDGEALTVVYANGEQLRVDVLDTLINVSAFLTEGRDIHGLLGNANGDVSDDLALRDGTVVAQPVSFADLYGQYANSWRIADAESLFTYADGEGTADFTDLGFPRGDVNLDDLPDAVLDAARTAVEGIEDETLRDAALRDFILTGDTSYIDAAERITPETVLSIEPEDPVLPSASVGVFASDVKVTEGDAGTAQAIFTVYRAGDASEALSINYNLGGDGDVNDVSGALSGTLDFNADETSKTVVIDIIGDTDFEEDETLEFTISVASGAAELISSLASIVVLNDDVDVSGDGTNGTTSDDLLFGTSGSDAFFGFDGDDTFFFNDKSDRVTENAGGGFDRINASSEVTLGRAEIEQVVLEDGGKYRVNGNKFATEIVGNSSSNILIGGGGGDTITGGEGTDYFAFLIGDADGTAVITDFGGSDQIALDDRLFDLGDGSIDVRQVTTVQISNAVKNGVAGFRKSTGEIWVDLDGKRRPGEAETIAILEDVNRLDAEDLLLF